MKIRTIDKLGPGHFYGIRAIAQRLGVNPITVYRWFSERNFPMYKRPVRFGQVWYSNEGLIQLWELRQVSAERAKYKRSRKGANSSPVEETGKEKDGQGEKIQSGKKVG